MRPVLVVAVLSLVVVACSSSADDAAPACSFVGSYSVTPTEKPGGTCGAAGNPTYTISDLGDGTYGLEVPGLQGGCVITDIGSCKGQGKCDLTLLDPVDPNNAVGGVSFAWTFSKDGFTGTNALVLPPAKSLPDGCQSDYAMSATRL